MRSTTKRRIVLFAVARKSGIMVHGCFMVGNLNETPASMEKTLQFAKTLRPDTAQFFPIMVYPGTVAYQEAKKRDYIQIETGMRG